MGFFAMLLIAAAAMAVLIPIKLSFSVMLCRNAARLRLNISILGLIRIKIMPAAGREKRAAERGRAKHGGGEDKHFGIKMGMGAAKMAMAVVKQRERYLRLDALTVRGSIGTEGDAAATALLCGAANELIPRLIRFLLPNRGACSVFVAPEFRFGAGWLYMEGIIALNIAKLIGIIGKEVIGYVASGGKHNAKHYGTIKANG